MRTERKSGCSARQANNRPGRGHDHAERHAARAGGLPHPATGTAARSRRFAGPGPWAGYAAERAGDRVRQPRAASSRGQPGRADGGRVDHRRRAWTRVRLCRRSDRGDRVPTAGRGPVPRLRARNGPGTDQEGFHPVPSRPGSGHPPWTQGACAGPGCRRRGRAARSRGTGGHPRSAGRGGHRPHPPHERYRSRCRGRGGVRTDARHPE